MGSVVRGASSFDIGALDEVTPHPLNTQGRRNGTAHAGFFTDDDTGHGVSFLRLTRVTRFLRYGRLSLTGFLICWSFLDWFRFLRFL
jgi:hypothetical protein